MPELVVPTVDDAARIAAVINARLGRSRRRRRSRPRVWRAGSRCPSSIPRPTCGSRWTRTASGRLRGRGGPEVDTPRRVSTCARCRAPKRWSCSSPGRRLAPLNVPAPGGGCSSSSTSATMALREMPRIGEGSRASARRTRWSARSRASSSRPPGRTASSSVRSRWRTRGCSCRPRRGIRRPLGLRRRRRSSRGAPRTSPRRGCDFPRGGSPGTAARSRVSASTGRGAARTTRSGGSACSACGGRGAAAGSARRCSASRSWRFAERGKRSAGLGVDAENTTGAVALYERVGMHVVRRSDTWERTA